MTASTAVIGPEVHVGRWIGAFVYREEGHSQKIALGGFGFRGQNVVATMRPQKQWLQVNCSGTGSNYASP